MAKKKRKPIRRKPEPVATQADENVVHLKPLLGLSPGQYLTILYSLIVLLILFMLLFYKGLRDDGEYVRVQTFPSGAAVRVDGNYVGSTPCEVLVKQGPHKVTVTKSHFAPISLAEEFDGPVFATLFVRPRRILDFDLELADPAALARDGLLDFAANPHIPEILTETISGGGNSPAAFEDMSYFIDKAKYFVANPLQLYSYLYALGSHESGLKVTTPASLISTVEKIAQFNQKYENFPFWLAVVMEESAAQRVVDTTWFSRVLSSYRVRYEQIKTRAKTAGQTSGGDTIVVQGQRFSEIPGGQLLQGDGEDGFATIQIPHPVAMAAFYLSETEVPNRMYREFIAENSKWDPANKTALVAAGLVDEDYLVSWDDGGDKAERAELPVTNVSFFAAQAYCMWFSSKLPASISDYTARLPFESEWEWAARGGLIGQDYPGGRPSKDDRFVSAEIAGPSPVGGSSKNGYGLRDMTGNVWEWCLDWYSPVRYLFTSLDPGNNNFDSSEEIPFGAEKVIRGGSWANEQELIKVSTRGSQPPEWCTPYLGFRILLSRYTP